MTNTPVEALVQAIMVELTGKLQPLVATLVAAEIEKRMGESQAEGGLSLPDIAATEEAKEEEEELQQGGQSVPRSILRTQDTPPRFTTQYTRSGTRRRISFGRNNTRLFQPTSPSSSSEEEDNGDDDDEEEEMPEILVYDAETHDTWAVKDPEEFVVDFSTDGIENMSTNDIKQVLYLARAKNLFEVMDRNVLSKANRMAWPGRRDHRRKKDKIIQQLDERLTKEWNEA